MRPPLALQERVDRVVEICSLNLLDQGQPFTFSISLETLATISLPQLHEQFTEPVRRWAGYLAGCLFLLREEGLIDLGDPKLQRNEFRSVQHGAAGRGRELFGGDRSGDDDEPRGTFWPARKKSIRCGLR